MLSQVILRTTSDDIDFEKIKPHISMLDGEQDIDQVKIADETLAQSYHDRIGMLHEGARLLVSSLGDAYEFKSDKIKTKADLLKKIEQKKREYQDEIDALKEQNDIEVLQELLCEFKKNLERIIRNNLRFNKKRAIHLLNEAISFAEFQRFTKTEGDGENAGKKTLVTINKSRINGQDCFCVQIDRPLTPLTEALKADYRKIKASVNSTTQDEKNGAETELPADSVLAHETDSTETKLPFWYRNMDADECRIFNNVIKDIDINNLNAIPNKLTSISGTRNFTQHEFYLFDKNYTPLTSRTCWRSSHLASRRLVKNNGDTKRSYDSKVHTRHNLLNVIIRALLAKQSSLTNGATFPLLIQTLITPIPITSIWGKPDAALDKEMNGAINAIRRFGVKNYPFNTDNTDQTVTISPEDDEGICEVTVNTQEGDQTNRDTYYLKLFSTNHPLNPGRFIIPTMTNSRSGREGMRLLDFAETHKKNLDSEKQKEIKTIMEAYEALLENPPSFISQVKNFFSFLTGKPIKERNRELFLSSYEQLLIEALGGLGDGACVSGKDRKACEILHTDAMKSYYAQYEELPTYKDSPQKRQNFIAVIKDLYLSRHHPYHAGLNSPGCDGIQTPELYFPKDIQKAIDKDNQQLRRDTTLARNTELGKIEPIESLEHKASSQSVTPAEPSINTVQEDMVLIDSPSDQDPIKSIEQILGCTHFWAENTTGKSEPTTNTILKEKFAMGKGKSSSKQKSVTLEDICAELIKRNNNVFRSKNSTKFRRLIKNVASVSEANQAEGLEGLKRFADQVQKKENSLILEKAEPGPLGGLSRASSHF